MSRDSFDLGLHTNIHEAVEYLLPRHLAKTGVAISGEQLESVLTTLSSSSPAT
jgi:hypothetical protein